MASSRQLGTWSAVVAFACCLFGGVWILFSMGFDSDDPLGIGLGFYFIGKAFFVGPMLYYTAQKSDQ